MMILSSLATLYFTKPGFRRAVKRFFDWSDEPKSDDTSIPSSPSIPTLTEQPRKGPAKDWMEWTKEDEERRDENVY